MCYNPLIRVVLPGLTEKGKSVGKLFKYDSLLEKELIENKAEYQLIPCGKCAECKTDYSKQWANRLYYEMKESSSCYFITLTYRNVECPVGLKKSDLDKFIHYLKVFFQRKGITNIKYFACGEYGSLNHRPHFHLIVFNAPLDCDIALEQKGSLGDTLYFSNIVDKCWQKGFHTITKANYSTFAYVSRYSMKKVGESDFFIDHYNLQKPFLRMSKGLGSTHFLKEMNEAIKSDGIVVFSGDNAKKVRMPRYFDKLLEKYKPVEFKELKDSRIYGDLVKDCKSKMSGLEIISVYKRNKAVKLDKIERLKRVI